MEPFNIKEDCLFCGKGTSSRKETKKEVKYKRVIYETRTLPTINSIRRRAVERADEWGNIVCAGMDGIIDLVAAEAKYHSKCYQRFSTKGTLEGDGVSSGRPKDAKKQEAFQKLWEYLETSEECQFSVGVLHDFLKLQRTRMRAVHTEVPQRKAVKPLWTPNNHHRTNWSEIYRKL